MVVLGLAVFSMGVSLYLEVVFYDVAETPGPSAGQTCQIFYYSRVWRTGGGVSLRQTSMLSSVRRVMA